MIHRWQPDVIMAWMNRASQLIPAEAPALKFTRLDDYPNSLKHYQNNDCMVANVPGIAEKCRALGWQKPVHVISNFPREVAPVPVSRRIRHPRGCLSGGRLGPLRGAQGV